MITRILPNLRAGNARGQSGGPKRRHVDAAAGLMVPYLAKTEMGADQAIRRVASAVRLMAAVAPVKPAVASKLREIIAPALHALENGSPLPWEPSLLAAHVGHDAREDQAAAVLLSRPDCAEAKRAWLAKARAERASLDEMIASVEHDLGVGLPG